MIEDYYIQIFIDSNVTVISKMYSYLLKDSFTINSAIEINMDNPKLSLPRIKKLMMLS